MDKLWPNYLKKIRYVDFDYELIEEFSLPVL